MSDDKKNPQVGILNRAKGQSLLSRLLDGDRSFDKDEIDAEVQDMDTESLKSIIRSFNMPLSKLENTRDAVTFANIFPLHSGIESARDYQIQQVLKELDRRDRKK